MNKTFITGLVLIVVSGVLAWFATYKVDEETFFVIFITINSVLFWVAGVRLCGSALVDKIDI